MASCFCTGPLPGQPLCPCMMRGVQTINGRYVRVEDLGPVQEMPKLEISQETKDGIAAIDQNIFTAHTSAGKTWIG